MCNQPMLKSLEMGKKKPKKHEEKVKLLKMWIISFLQSFEIVLFSFGYGNSSASGAPEVNK